MSSDVRRDAAVNEFPSFFPPLLIKELRQGLRTKGFVLFVILFPLCLAIPFLFYFLMGDDVVDKKVLSFSFWLCAAIFFLMFNPIRSLSSVHQEKATRSNELIALTQISPMGIVSQKWISYTLQTILVGMVLLPFFLLRYFAGGVELVPELFLLGGMFSSSCLMTAVGLWVSGMPSGYRILYAILAISTFGQSIMGLGMSYSMGSGSGFKVGMEANLAMILSNILIFIGCRAILVQASRWFTSPSQSTAYAFRKAMALMVLVTAAGLLLALILKGHLDMSIVMATFCGFAVAFLLWGLLIEMLLPEELKAIHLRKLEGKGRLARWLMPLWASGWQSGALFFLLVVLYAVGMIACFETRDTEKICRVVLLIWANITFLTIVFHSLWKRLRVHSLVIFPVICIVLLLVQLLVLSSDRHAIEPLFSLLPVGCFLSLSEGDSAAVMTGNWCFIGASFFVLLLMSLPYWRQYGKWEKEVLSSRQGAVAE